MNHTYTVKVVNRTSGEVVKELDVIGVSKAGKVLDGISINLNKDAYYVTMDIKE